MHSYVLNFQLVTGAKEPDQNFHVNIMGQIVQIQDRESLDECRNPHIKIVK